jgi:ABC-type dipeptide/oligopeptide/nickel transport system ATPase subunit
MMNEAVRNFQVKPAVRERVPLLVGLMGPSGSGKTFSALRLATGIQTLAGGDIYGIDTEARRMLHYADRFKFKHVQFDAPFSSLDYLAALEQCVKAGAGVIIVDSMSHEHESPGGMIDFAEKELDRIAGSDWAKRERVKMLSWQRPKAARRRLINGILQLNANFIFCFRAKNTVKPLKINGKTEIVPMGFMPIAGEEFLFEQTVNCLLLPNSGGVPTWQSENMGERQMIKSPVQFREIFAANKPLDEDIGRALATWAKGDQGPRSPTVSDLAPVDVRKFVAPLKSAAEPSEPADAAPASPPPATPEAGAVLSLEAMAQEAATRGREIFDAFYKSRSRAEQAELRLMKPDLEKLFPKEEAAT